MLNPRRRNVYQAAGVVLLVVIYYQLVEFAARLVEKTGISPFLTLWPVFAVFFGGTLFLYHAISQRPGSVDEFLAEIGGRIFSVPARVFRSQAAE